MFSYEILLLITTKTNLNMNREKITKQLIYRIFQF